MSERVTAVDEVLKASSLWSGGTEPNSSGVHTIAAVSVNRSGNVGLTRAAGQ